MQAHSCSCSVSTCISIWSCTVNAYSYFAKVYKHKCREYVYSIELVAFFTGRWVRVSLFSCSHLIIYYATGTVTDSQWFINFTCYDKLLQMGRIFLEHPGGKRIYCCGRCDTALTNRDELASTVSIIMDISSVICSFSHWSRVFFLLLLILQRFTGATGRAFLFNKVWVSLI